MTLPTRRTDVLVIGGGVIGLCSAYYLLKRGYAVTLVEQSHIGAGASPGNAGHIVPSHVVPLAAPGVVGQALKWMLKPATSPFGLKLRLSPDYLAWLWRFAASCTEEQMRRSMPILRDLGYASAGLYAQLIADEGLACNYDQKGLLNVYRTQHAFEEGAKEAELLKAHGVRTIILDRAAVRQLEPAVRDEIVGGIHWQDDGHLHPALFLRQMSDLVAERGAVVDVGTKVTGFQTNGNRIVAVTTDRGNYEASQVVLAAGVWSSAVARSLRLKLPIQPARGYSLTLPRPAGCPEVPMILAERKVAVTPMGEWLRLTGRLELGDSEQIVDPRQIEGIQAAARAYLLLNDDLTPTETWAGLRPTTPDGVPIIGRSKRIENLILAVGHAMLGLSLGPVTGSLVSQLAHGDTPDIDMVPLQAERFG